MVDAHHLDGMVDVPQHVTEGSLSLLAEETSIKRDLHHPTLQGQGLHLFVSQIAWMVTQGTTTTVTAHDGGRTQFQGIPERRFGGMAHIHQHPYPIHLLHHAAPEVAQSSVLRLSPAGVTDIVVSVVAKREIHNTSVPQPLHIAQVASQGIAVLHPHHDGLTALLLQTVEVIRGTSQGDMLRMSLHHVLQLVQDGIGILHGLLQRSLVAFLLGQICHHDACIEHPLIHLVEIDKHMVIPVVETYPLWEKHGGVLVAVQREDMAMYPACLCKE